MGAGCCNGERMPPPLNEGVERSAAIEDQASAATDSCRDAGEGATKAQVDNSGCCASSEKCDDECVVVAASMTKDEKYGDDLSRSSISEELNQTIQRYKSLLNTAKCICRSVLEEKGISCCTKKASAKSGHCTSTAKQAKPDCASGTIKKACNSQKAADGKEGLSSGCCSGKAEKSTSGCRKRGFVTPPPEITGFTAANAADRMPRERDLEMNDGSEHVVMSVEGMTCNDCADKLERTLKALPGTDRVRVNFIRGQAELYINGSLTNPQHVLDKARTATGFVINRLKSQGSDETLNLLVSGTAVRTLCSLDIDGLNDVVVLNKTTVQVDYDPTVIGARDLMDKFGGLTTGLASPGADPSVSGGRRRFYKLLTMTALSTILTIPVVVLAWGEGLVSEYTRGIVSFVLGTFVQLLAVPVFYKPALRALIVYHALELDMLVVVSITAAYLYSIVAFSFRLAGKPLETAEFFETSTLLITLVMMGRLLASYARIRAVAAVSMRSLQSTTALLVEDGGKLEREIDSRLLQYGDHFKVLPHCRIPTDGVVVEGISDVDESMLTGESLPVLKQPGSDVIAGTVNSAGSLLVRLKELPGKNTVTDIARLVEEASNSKPRVQDVADHVASYFLPVVSVTSLLVFIIWIIVGLKGRGESAGEAVSIAVTYAIAVLAVSCPCALGLAVPMVLVVAGGIAARGGVIIKSAECTERSRKVTDVVFDKTGTLTEPDLDVLAEDYFSNDQDHIAGVVRGLVSESKHPVSAAVAKHLAQSHPPVTVSDLQSIPGAGVEALVDGVVFRAGNPHWTGNENHELVRQHLDDGLTLLLVTRDSTPVALFGLRTRVRSEAADVVSNLKSRGITVHLVSGDQHRAVESIASSVGIDATNAIAQYTPDQKQAYVAALMEDGKYVLFCGDGTNDAVAVAQANIGAQVSDSIASSDVTRGAADVVLLSGLNGIPFLMEVSRASFRRIVFNFAWSATYNVLAILLAGGAFVKIRIPPAYAGAGELISVLPVIGAAMSMLLLKLKP